MFLTVNTIPPVGEVFLFNTLDVEPLPLAIRVLALDHLAVGGALAVTVFGLEGVVDELAWGMGAVDGGFGGGRLGGGAVYAC